MYTCFLGVKTMHFNLRLHWNIIFHIGHVVWFALAWIDPCHSGGCQSSSQLIKLPRARQWCLAGPHYLLMAGALWSPCPVIPGQVHQELWEGFAADGKPTVSRRDWRITTGETRGGKCINAMSLSVTKPQGQECLHPSTIASLRWQWMGFVSESLSLMVLN